MGYTLARPIQDLIDEFEKLPGIGPKSAARLAYYFLNAPEYRANKLAESLSRIKKELRPCGNCFNISEGDLCSICTDPQRDDAFICVVEEPLDVLAIENSNIFNGRYHVLGGVISPLSGIGPENLRIRELESKVKSLVDKGKHVEIIIATNPTMEGEATSMYILESLKEYENIVISRIARGLPTGADIEYADYMTLKKSIENRINMKE